mgnify:CR=1 FL=1
MVKRFKYMFVLGALALMMSSAQAKPNSEISHDERSIAAQKVLNDIDDAAAVYVKGLCCPSCAIGIRKKVSKLEFIDTTRLKKGVSLDTKTQLATIALKKDELIDVEALAKAIRDAGYTPFYLYQIQKEKLETTVIPPEADNSQE